MRFFRILFFLTAISLALWGCDPSTSSEGSGSDNGEGSGSESTEYTLTVSTDPSEGGSAEPSDSTYEEGTEVTVEAVPDEGWTFDSWIGDRESDENPLSFTISEDTELTANFIEATSTEYDLSVSATPSEGGTVEPTDSTYEEGADVTVEATPNEGWKFDGWTGDRESGNNPLSFQIDENTELTANFSETTSDEPAEYNLTVSTDPSNGGSVDPSSGTYEEGTEITIEATSNNGFTFVEWTGDQQSTDNPFTFTIAENTEITAVFDQQEQPEEYSLSVSADPSEGGSVKPVEGTYEEGTEVTVEATTDEGWAFEGWTGDVNSGDNPVSVTITSNMNITANFKKRKYDLNISTHPGEAGVTSPEQGTYEYGTTVTVSATADTGWKFIEWTGDIESNENPIEITITKDTELQANFGQAKHDLAVTTEPSEGGSVSPSEGSYEDGTEVTVEAIPEEGWTFNGWTGDRESDENPLSFIIAEDTKLTANFSELAEYSLSVSADPPEGGSVTPSSGTYQAGTQVSVVAEAEPGWEFRNWSGDMVSEAKELIFHISENTNLVANFYKKEYELEVQADPIEGGSVSPSRGTYKYGTEVEVEANVNRGWNFVKWSGDVESTQNPLTITIKENTSLTANLERVKSRYTVEMEVINQDDVVNLSFGQHKDADYSFNEGIDQYSPPAPPNGVLHAYFDRGSNSLFKDFHSDNAQNVTWNLNYQVAHGEQIKLEWSITDDSKIPGTLILTDDTESFEVDMLNQTSYTFTGGTSGTLVIEYSL